MDLFGRLEQLRARRGLTICELAALAGIDRQTYYLIRRTNDARVSVLSGLASALGLGVNQLVEFGELAPRPEDVALARCRDLIRWDGTDRPRRFMAAVELEWLARHPDPQPVRPPAAEGEQPVGVEGGGLAPVHLRDHGEEE